MVADAPRRWLLENKLTQPTYVGYSAGVKANHSYEVQAVARAAGIPARRLEGWIERRVVVPTVAAAGTGTRTRFSREDALRVALIAEIQRLFGSNLRPGSIASKIGRDPLTLPQVDTALRLAIGEETEGKRSSVAQIGARLKLTLYVHYGPQGLSIGATRKPAAEILETTPVALFIDPAAVWRRIRVHLEDQAHA